MKNFRIITHIVISVIIISLYSCKSSTVSPIDPGLSHVDTISHVNTPGYAYGIYVTKINNINFALVADGVSGLQVINISNIQFPTTSGSYNTTGESYDVFGAAINGASYAFISDGPQGYDIINITNPSGPQLDTIISFSGDRILTSFVDTTNRKAYIGAFSGMITILDLSSLPAVSVIGTYNTGLNNVNCIQISNGLGYIAEGTSGIEIINVAIPSSPSYVGSCNTPGTAYYLQVTNSKAYVADADYGLTIVDISNPFNPLYLRSVAGKDLVLGLALNPGAAELFTAERNAGMEVFGTVDPGNPSPLGYFNSAGIGTNIFYYYPYIFLADGPDGLRILKYSVF